MGLPTEKMSPMARLDVNCPLCGYDKFQAQRIYDCEWGNPELTEDGGVRVTDPSRVTEAEPEWLIICDNCGVNWDIDEFREAVEDA